MIEKIPAPRGRLFDGAIHLGDIAASNSNIGATDPTPSDDADITETSENVSNTSEAGTLPPNTLLTQEQFEDGQRRWVAGETVQSEMVPLAEIPMSAEDWRVLSDYPDSFRHIYFGALPGENTGGSGWTDYLDRAGLTAEQAAAIQRAFAAFRTVVQADCTRGGLGEVAAIETAIFIGHFDPDEDPIDWHADSPSTQGRYVVAFGENMGTLFAQGPIDNRYINTMRIPIEHPADNQNLTITAARPGVVTRFAPEYTLHRSPERSGFRLFMSINVSTNPDDMS